MISCDERRTLTASCADLVDAQIYIETKALDGWKVLVPPFVTAQTMVDRTEECTVPVDSEWTFVLHRL